MKSLEQIVKENAAYTQKPKLKKSFSLRPITLVQKEKYDDQGELIKIEVSYLS
jgi:hypothetical protein